MTKCVPYEVCGCGKRGFYDEHDAARSLGRAQTKRDRAARAWPSRRGMVRESRYYECPSSGLYHLTSESKRKAAPMTTY